MSENRDKVATSDSRQTQDLDAWREEVQSFCRQTITRLHEIVDTDTTPEQEARQATPARATPARAKPVQAPAAQAPATQAAPFGTKTVLERPAEASPRRTTEAARPAAGPLTAPIEAAARDLDSSQDRLANLKREIAAKLSKTAQDRK